ncbi:TonB-dependent receptor plug domain-containing protein [Phenylobacterium sp.]|uniref:TonB-dependent receptor plug domain-containing protein n=1 Tax=Phenylobacterium sp. TaxID=1871053 RepID=UPI0035B42B97
MQKTIALFAAASTLILATAARAADDGQAGQAFELGQIIVTAPRVQGVAIDANTLSSEAIYAFSRPTLDDAVNLIPGVASSNTGGSRNERVVSVRGFNRFQAPLMIDGVRVFLPADNRLDYGRFLTPDVAEVQVAKGYVSVLDGPDGMGGAINLVTRKPTKPFEAEAQASLDMGRKGEYAGYTAFGLIGTRQDRWYAQASYARRFQDHTDLSGDFTPTASEDGGERDLSRAEDWRLNLKVGVTPNDTDEYSLNYTKQEGEKLAPLSTVDPVSTQRFWTWPYWNIDSLYFLSTTALSERLTLKTKIYRNTFDNLLRAFDNRNENTQTLGRAFNSYYADEAHGGALILAVQATDADKVSLAAYYRRDEHVEWQQGFPSGAVEPHQTSLEDSYSLAVENVLELSPALTFTAGASYDWRDLKRAEDYTSGAYVFYPLRDSHAANGQAKLSWRLDDKSEVYASISSRARFPTLFERFSSRFGGAVSNPDLKPERATNFEVGGARELGGVHLEGAVFYSRLDDVIVSVPFIYTTCTAAGVCTDNAVSQSRNVGEGEYWGLEGAVVWRAAETLSLGANYTYMHRDLTDPNNAAFRPTDVPAHKGFVYADWRPLARLRVLPSVDLASDRWTVNTAGTRYYRTGAYAVANLRVDYELADGLEVGVGGRNLFDQNYQLVDGFPEQGRTLFLSLRARR